jgi:hypothetical protein
MTTLRSTLVIGPNAAELATAHAHSSSYGHYTIGSVDIADLTIQTNHETGPDDLAAFLDALAAKVRDAHAIYLARQTDSEGDPQ